MQGIRFASLALLSSAALLGCHGGVRCCPCPSDSPAGFAVVATGGPASAGGGGSMAASDLRTITHASGVVETALPNGMRILVKPQPDDPLVTTMIWYAVGSRDEDVGETGLSHYLEHMMFKGTDRRPKGGIDKETQKNGGSNNASTRNDATEYHFTFPADRWEVPLDIEADRMRGSNVQQAEFDAEKNVILQELKRGLDDPEDVLFEAVNSGAFRVNRYHHPVIGWAEDVRSTTRERMRKYYLKHYTPDRATLVVVGGVDPAAVIQKAAQLFSPIARGDVTRFEQVEPPALGESRLTLPQEGVPRLMMAFRSMKTLDPREPLLDLASSILAGEKTSRLEKRLVDTGIAASVTASNDSRRDDGLFWVQAEPTEGHTLDECQAAIVEVLGAMAKDGPTAEELQLVRAKLLADQVYQQESASGLASRIGSVAVLGDWQYFVRYPKVLEAATPETIRDVCKAVFDLKRATIGRGVPKDAEPAAGGGEHGGDAPRRASGIVAEKGAHGARARADGGAGGAVAGSPGGASAIERALDLKPLRVVLDNGLVVLTLRRTNAPVFSARLEVRDGRVGESAPGLNEMVGSLLEEGTTKRDGAAVAAAIGAVGGSYSADGGGVGAKTLSKDAQLALDVIAEVATSPRFAAQDVEKVRGQQLQGVARELDTPQAVARAKFDALIYGEGHPLGRSALGTAESVKALTREQAVAHHARFWVPRNAVLAVVSDRDPQEVVAFAKKSFGAWADAPAPKVELPAPPAPAAKSLRVDMKREQTNQFLGHIGIVRTDPDYVALEVMDNVLGTGAGFTDRLSMNVRDIKGLAYTVYGNLTGNSARWPGTFRVYAGTNPEDAALARAEMRKEIQGILDRPPTPQELEGAKAALRGGFISRCETAADVAGVLLLCERYALGFDYPRRYLAAVEAVTAADVTRVAKAHVHPDALIEVVVGRPDPK